jgi:serine/threonine-protein kinase
MTSPLSLKSALDELQQLRTRRQLDDALAMSTRIVEDYPVGVAHYAHGLVLLDRREIPSAVSEFTIAIDADPTEGLYYLHRGYARMLQTDYEGAALDFDRTVTLSPDLIPKCLALRGSARAKTGRLDEAMADYRECIALDPKSYRARTRLADLLRDTGQFEESMSEYNRALAMAPKYVSALVGRSHLHSDLANFEAERDDLLNGVTIDANYWAAHLGLAGFYCMCKKRELRDAARALVHAKRACELTDWTEASSLESLALAYAESNDYAAAVYWEEQALQRAPADFADDFRERLERFRRKLAAQVGTAGHEPGDTEHNWDSSN